jgi:hypothetical protein
MTDEQASLTPAQLATAFPFHLTLDHETRIRAVGLSIGRVLGEHAVGRPSRSCSGSRARTSRARPPR